MRKRVIAACIWLLAILPAAAQHVEYLDKLPRNAVGPIVLVETDRCGKPTYASVVVPAQRSDYNDFCRWMAKAVNYPLVSAHKFYLRFPQSIVGEHEPLPWSLLAEKQHDQRKEGTTSAGNGQDGSAAPPIESFGHHEAFWPMAEFAAPPAPTGSADTPAPQMVLSPPAVPGDFPANQRSKQ